MAQLNVEQLKKLAAVEIMAEVNDNFDILGVMNHLKYIPGYDAPAATDGKIIIISDKLFDYTVKDIYFILNHEFDHIVYRHHSRSEDIKNINWYVANVAEDIIINEILENEGITPPGNALSRAGVSEQIGEKITGRNSEDVYAQLIKVMNDKQNEKKNNGKGEPENGEGENGEPENGEGENGDSSGSPLPGGQSTPQQSAAEALDEILGAGKGASYVQGEDDQEKLAEAAKSADQIEESDQEKIDLFKERVLSKMSSAGRKRTDEITRGYVPPKIDWKSMLRQFLGRYLKRAEVRNPSRPTRRYDDVLGSRVIIPSNQGYIKTPKINLYLDVSGSMSSIINNVRQVLAEAKRYFKQYKAKYFEFDTELFELNKIEFFNSSGAQGGGTDIKKVIRHYAQDDKADLAILITDAEDEFSAELASIDKPMLILTNNTRLETSNPKVTLVKTDFE